VVSLGATSDTAEEVAQAAWARGWERRDQIRNPGSVGAWVNSIAKNIFRNGLRQEQRRESVSETDSATQDGSPFALMEVKNILRQCRSKDRMVLYKYYLEGYSAEEISADLGLSSSAVRVRLLRIRQSLRARLAPVCRPADDTYAWPKAS
jgi:RNA polymerase sigma factor (sigma-70 family)